MCRSAAPKRTWRPRARGWGSASHGSRPCRPISGVSAPGTSSPVTAWTAASSTRARTRAIFDLTGTAEQTLEALARLAPKATLSLQQGEAGSTVLAGGRFYRPRRRFNVQLVDPLGAGDAYVAGFLWAVLGKRELQEAVEIGNAVAALKCSIWGDVALVTPRDVEEVLSDGPDVRR